MTLTTQPAPSAHTGQWVFGELERGSSQQQLVNVTACYLSCGQSKPRCAIVSTPSVGFTSLHQFHSSRSTMAEGIQPAETAPHLCQLPSELIIQTLGNLDARSLCRAEMVCRLLRDCAQCAFPAMYGRGVKHLSLSSFRQLAIDEYQRNPIPFEKDEDITNALNDIYNELLQQPDDYIEDRAIMILLRIRRSDLRLSALGIEATAAPLVLLGPYGEADTYFKSCVDIRVAPGTCDPG